MINQIPKRIGRGDLAEIALTSDAKRFIDSYPFFMPDPHKETNIPGRVHAGYVIEVQSDSISLSSDWNKLEDKPEYGGTKYYLNAIESCKLRRKAGEKRILNSLFSGFSVIARAYGNSPRLKV